MSELRSHLEGSWRAGEGEPITLRNPATEAEVATVRASGTLGAALAYARDVGGPALRSLSIPERAALLHAMSAAIQEHRDELLSLSTVSGGNTRGDAKFDVDGAAGVLAHYAELAGSLGDHAWILDGEATPLIRGGKIRGQHVLLPRRGVAVHINAFNFPAWGMIGKAAVAILAGMPVLSKPATSTAALAHRIVEILVDGDVLPAGALSLLMGPAGDLLDHLGPQDVVAFTGSAATGARIRGHGTAVANNVRVNIEADSLNAAIIGPDVGTGSELFDLLARDAQIELTQKAGQKCTATRRILVPEGALEAVRDVLVERLDERAGQTGDPSQSGVRMGPLSTAAQLRDGRAGVAALAEHARIVRGDPERKDFIGVEPGQGYFLEPILLEATAEAALAPGSAFHGTEVFGPVATLLPYDGTVETATRIIAAGGGSLVSTVYSDDRAFTAGCVAEVGPHLGRLVLATEKIAGASLSPGAVLPQVNHGGPGRAGAGEELGGRHGMELYLQRTTVQGGASQIARLLGTA